MAVSLAGSRIRWGLVVVTAAGLAIGIMLSERLGERLNYRTGERGQAAESASSGCTVNWLDTLAYKKPVCIDLSKPTQETDLSHCTSEGGTTPCWWVDLSSGSGSTCTQASPCDSMDDVIGKAGTTGGPAIIYVKGTGGMSWFNDTVYGAGADDCRTGDCTDYVLIRTWPAGTTGCTSECTATFTGNSNMNSPTNVHHVMFDGGEDLKIRFDSNSASNYAHNIMADNVIVYRTQMYCTADSNELGWQVGATNPSDNVWFINNEFYDCDGTGNQASAVYVGPGAGGGYTDVWILNNIIRSWGGEGLEVNPRVTSSGLTIAGNAMRDNGYITCPLSWQCRPHIVVSVQSGGGNNGTEIYNNLMWDSASGCIWDRGGGTPVPLIYNNTCYDYGKGTGGGGPNPEGIAGFADGGTATVRNNIVYAPNGTDPFDGSSYTATNNLCGSGESCGTSSQTWSANTVESTNENTVTYMTIDSSSEAYQNGFDTTGTVTDDYQGNTRAVPVDIGAFEL